MEHYVGSDFAAMPWADSVKRQRGAAVRAVALEKWASYFPMLQKDSCTAIKGMMEAGRNGVFAINPKLHLYRVATNLGFALTYGKTLEDFGGVDFVTGFIQEAAKITA